LQSTREQKNRGRTLSKGGRTRAFIVGCPRSGTSVLRELLNTHPEITAFSPESQFFHHLEASHPVAKALGLASGRAPKALARFQSALGRPTMIPRFRFVRSYVNAFVKLLDELSDTPVWVEKTPGHLAYIDLIERTVPDPRFIHILRSGEDVVTSIYEQTQIGREPWWARHYKTVDDCINEWRIAVRTTWRYRNRPNHIIVSYEDLVADPELQLRGVCEFLGVGLVDGMTEGFEVRDQRRSKFHRLFTEEQQRHILEQLDGWEEAIEHESIERGP
jgi:hypothetical protein